MIAYAMPRPSLPDRDTEEDLRDTPACSKYQRRDKSGCRKLSIGREQMVHQQ